MTQVLASRRGDRCALRLLGHAGDPAVCAAVSSLVYALAGYLRSEEAGAELLTCALEPGAASLEARGGAEVRAAFALTETGLRLLAESFPGTLQLQ